MNYNDILTLTSSDLYVDTLVQQRLLLIMCPGCFCVVGVVSPGMPDKSCGVWVPCGVSNAEEIMRTPGVSAGKFKISDSSLAEQRFCWRSKPVVAHPFASYVFGAPFSLAANQDGATLLSTRAEVLLVLCVHGCSVGMPAMHAQLSANQGTLTGNVSESESIIVLYAKSGNLLISDTQKDGESEAENGESEAH